MRIFMFKKNLCRLLIAAIIFIIILPLMIYFTAMSTDSSTVHFHTPKGDAVKVISDIGFSIEQKPVYKRYLYYIFDFYQNKL